MNETIFKIIAYVPNILFLIVLLFLTLKQNRKSLVNLCFSYVLVALTWWLGCLFVADMTTNNTVALFAVRIGIISPLWVPPIFYIFSKVFPTAKKPIKKVDYIAFIPALVMTPFVFTGFNVSAVQINTWGASATSGPLQLAFGAYFLILVGLAIRNFVYSYRHGQAIQKVQILYVITGFIISGIGLLITNIILVSFGISRYGVMGLFTIWFFVGFTAYAIVRHQLMDIRLIALRSLTFLILLIILAAILSSATFGLSYFTPTHQLSLLQSTIVAVSMAFIFQPIRRWVAKVTDKTFFKGSYDSEALLDTLAHSSSSTIVLTEMLYKVNDILVKNMKLSRSAFVLFKDGKSVLTVQASGAKDWPKIDVPEYTKMVSKGILIYDALEEGSQNKKRMHKYTASIMFPLKTEGELIGVFMAGEKSSGDMFTDQDIKVFEIIAPEIAVAIQNDKAYDKIEHFNVTLRQEIKKATQELETKNNQLRELDKAKDEFISMASHQLRTPLTAIKGYLSMLLEGDAGEIKVSQYDFVNESYNGANRMVGLINDLLNVSRMETGRFFLEPVEVDLDKMIIEEIKQLQNHAKEKGLYIIYKKIGKVPAVWADETKIRQVVMNFIDNAVYYTTKGGVTVHLSHDAHDVIFEVQDTGIGVPKAQQRNLFTKFFRADNARHVRPDGTGLGIYLAKRVLDDHHGKLIFHSVEGKGSTFGFKLPIKSNLHTKTVKATKQVGNNGSPAIGELAAGAGVPAETLAPKVDAKDIGLEPPLNS